MRFSTIAIVASVIAAVSALEYPFKSNGPCVQNCLDTAGKSMFPNWSMDPNSPYFMESLEFPHNRGTPAYTTFMGKTGMCNSKCPMDEQNLYKEQYQAKNDWYVAQKSASTATGSASVPTKTSAPDSKSTNAASGVAASTGLIGAAAIGAAALLF